MVKHYGRGWAWAGVNKFSCCSAPQTCTSNRKCTFLTAPTYACAARTWPRRKQPGMLQQTAHLHGARASQCLGHSSGAPVAHGSPVACVAWLTWSL